MASSSISENNFYLYRNLANKNHDNVNDDNNHRHII